jgi:hypothetical protein
MANTTVSTTYHSDKENHALLRKWCDQAAHGGGSFAINYNAHTGYTTYTINWPWPVEVTTEALR